MGDTLLTSAQAADLLEVSRRTLTRLVARGEIPHVRICACLRFRRESLDAWLRTCEVFPGDVGREERPSRGGDDMAWVDRIGRRP